MQYLRSKCVQALALGFSGFLLAGAASAQVILTSPASPELVGSNISIAGTGYPAGTITTNQVNVTVTPSAGNGPAVTFCLSTTCGAASNGAITGAGSSRNLAFKLPAALTANLPYTATVSVSGKTSTNTAFTTAATATITINPAGSIINVSPGAAQRGNPTVKVTITGLYTHFGALTSILTVGGTPAPANNQCDPSVISSPSGNSLVTPCAVQITGSTATTQTMTATFEVGNNVTPGVYPVTVTTGSEVATLPVGFVVTASPGLSFSLINPNSGAQGTTLPNVDVQGINTHFAQGVTTANFGNGITASNIHVNSVTDMTATLTIDPLAPAGGRIVTVVTGGEFALANNGFTVTTSGASIVSATPTAPVAQGTNATLALTGLGTHWVTSGTTVSFAGGIDAGSITVNSNTSLTVNISVPPGVAPGIYGVTTTTAGEVATLSNAVTVSAATPLLSGAAPSSGVQGANNLNVVVAGVNTSFNVGAISANFGPMITVNSVTPNGALQATINISIGNVAVAGGRSVTLTSNGTLFSFEFTVTPSNATVTSVTPNTGLQQSSLALAVTGANTHWVQGTTIASLGDDHITINEVTVNSPISATVNITIGAQAALGLHTLTMTTGGEIASEANAFTVQPFTPSLSLAPSSGMVGNVVNVNFNGDFTHFQLGTTVANIDGEGVTIQNFTVLGPKTASAQFVIAPNAPASPAFLCAPGNRNVTVTTGLEIVTAPFCVTSTPAVLVSITPSQSPQNNNLNVTIIGQFTNFQNATLTTPGSQGTAPTTLGFGPDITVNNFTIDSATSLSANITVAANAALGWRQAFVNTGAEQLTIGFLISAPASATLVSVTPAAGQQGQSIQGVTITGNLTNFSQGTTLAILGAGITVSNLQILSPQVATATIAISPTTPTGPRTVEMITGAEDVSAQLFTVNQGVASIVFTPDCNNNITTFGACAPTLVTVAQGAIVPFSVTGTGTHFLQGETTMDFGGSDIVVTQLTVNSPTSLSGQIVVSATAIIGFRMATAMTGGEVAPTSSFAVDVVQTTPTILNLSVNSAPQGTTHLQVQINGQLTTWVNGTTMASFGNNNGLLVNSVTVTSPTQATIDLTIAGTAFVSPVYGLTVNTQHGGGNIEQESLSSVFSVTQGAAIITKVAPVSAGQGATVDVLITGQNTSWINGTTTAFFTEGGCVGSPNPGINSGLPTVTSTTSATLSIAISPNAQTGLQTLCMATLGELVNFQNSFTITPSTPTLNQVSPVSAEQGQQLTVSLLGQFTHWAQGSTTITFGEGISLVGNLVVSDATHAAATILVDPLADIGSRNVVLDTPIGGGDEIVQGTSFFTVVAGPAILSTISPSTGNQGTHILMQVNGEFTHWSQELSQVTINGAGFDITINGVQVQSSTSLVLDMNISPTANLGVRTVYVSTGGENVTLQNGFLVTGGVPSISGISPSSVQQAATAVNVQISGIFTHWDNTTMVSFGPNITFGTPQWTVNSNTSITAIINVAAGAPLGLQTVTVQTGSQILTTSINILSNAPPTPYISYEYPSVALVGQTLDVNLVGQFTHWLPLNPSNPSDPNTQITFASGIVVNNLQVTGENTAVANITIVPTAGVGVRTVTMTTGAEIETTSFTVTVGTPTITLVTPGSIIQGQTLDVDVVGQYTTFNNTPGTATVFTFGNLNSQITVNTVTLSGPTAARLNISAGIEAPLGGVSVKETGGTEVAFGNFAVTPSQATITSVTPNTAPQGTQQVLNVTGFATNWVQGVTVFNLGGFGITTPIVSGPGTAQITVTIPATASVGEYTITATTGGEFAFLNNAFVVTPGTPILVSSTGSPVQQGKDFSVGIIGQVTNFIPGWPAVGATSVDLGTGVNVTGINVTSGLGITVTGNVNPTTFLGSRNVTVTTGAQVLVLFGGFDVTPGTAQITLLSPNSGLQGQGPFDVAITGTNTNFQQGVTTANFGQGIGVTNFVVSDLTDAVATITISPAAAVTQNSVTLTTLGETATIVNGFTIIAATPVIDFISPTSLRQGQTGLVSIAGSFTSFNSSSAVSFGAGVTVNSFIASTPRSLTANITVSPTATVGTRTVIVDAVSLVNGFTVTSDAATGGVFAYTSNVGGANLSGYISDPGTGILTALSDAPYPAGNTPEKVVIGPSGFVAYAANTGANTISVYNLNAATGTLTPVPGSPVSAGPNPANIVFAPTGQFAYVFNAPGSIAAYAVDPITGLLIPAAVATTPGTAITISPSGLFAWILNGAIVTPYSVNLATGALTQLAVAGGTAGTAPTSISVLPSGAYLYTTNGGSNDISAFAINAATGALAPVPGSPFAAGASPQSVALSPSGEFAFVANSGSHNISAFTVNKATDGSLTPIAGSPFAAGNGVDSLTTDPAGVYLYATNSGDNTVSGYTVDPVTGVLAALAGSPYPAGANPQSIVVGQAGAAITSVLGDAPTSADQNTSAPLIVTGRYTHFDATTTLSLGSGITVTGLTAVNPGYLTATINVSATAPLGLRNVVVSTGGETLTLVNGFAVTQGAPVISSNSSPVNFPDTLVSLTSNPIAVNITNTGSGTATFTSFSVAGSGDFSFVGTNCGSGLAATASCQALVTFSPSAAGARTATLTVTSSNATGSPLNIALNGNGVAQTYLISVTPTLTFSTPLIVGQSSAPASISVQNIGNSTVSFIPPVFILSGANTADFVYSGTTCGGSLASGATCAASYVFSPTGSGTRTAIVNVYDVASGSPQQSTLSGTGVAVAKTLQLSTSAVNFPTLNVGTTSGTMNVNVTSIGNTPVTFGASSFAGTGNPGDFALTINTCTGTLAVNASCSLSFTFTPTTPGTRNATYNLADDATGNPQAISLSGDGQVSPESVSSVNPADGTSGVPLNPTISLVLAEPAALGSVNNSSVTLSTENAAISTGPDAMLTAPGLCCGYATTNSFNLSSATTLNQVTFANWISPGTLPTTIDWAITTSPNSGIVASGSSADLSNAFLYSVRSGTYNVYNSTFAIPNVSLTAGTYWLLLQNCQPVGTGCSWGFASSSGTAMEFLNGALNASNLGTASFTLSSVAALTAGTTVTPSSDGQTLTVTLASNLAPSTLYAINVPEGGFTDQGGNPVSAFSSTFTTGTSIVPPNISLNNSSLNFNTQNVGSASSAQTVNLSSNGNGTVTFSAPPAFTLTGANPGDFTISANTCGATLAVGSSCAVSVEFTPTAGGSRSAILNIADNAGNSPQQVTLSGTGQLVAKTLSFNVNNLNFGAQNAGATSGAQSVTVTSNGNTPVTFTSVTLIGSNPSEFTIGANTCTGALAANAQCSVSVTFTPAANGARSASLQFVDDATGNPQTVLLTGTGQSATQNLVFNPESLVYGVYTVGAGASTSVQFENVGTSSVAVASVQINGPNASDFSVTGNTCTTLAENATCSVTIAFKATAAGPRVANLQVNDNAPGAPHNVPLLGTGESVTQTVSQSVTNITYGVTNVGASSSGSFTLYSLGTGGAILETPVLAGANPGDFSITGNNCPLDPALFNSGASCTISVSFAPTAAGSRVATITVNDNTPESPHVVALTGTGQAVTAVSSQSVTNITYGVTNVGATASSSFTLYNFGTGPVTFAAPALGGSNPGDFSIGGNNCPVGPVASGGSCTISVLFAPTAAGVRTATVTVTDNTAQSPHVVMLTGTGQSVTAITAQSVTNITYPVVNVGASSGSSFTLYSLGTGSITLAAPTLSGSNPGDFSIGGNNCPVTLNSGGSCTISVLFAPTAAGVRTATVTVTDNTAQSPHIVTLTGTGQTVTAISAQSVTNITYPVVNVGASSSGSFTLYSLGTGSITLAAPALGGSNPGDFSIGGNNCPATLNSGGSCTIGVSFIPTVAGVRTATVTVTDNTAQSPHVVTLTGTGQTVTQSLSFSVGTVAYGAVNVGIATNGSVSMYNQGTGPVTVSSYVLGGSNPADFSITGNACPTAPATLNVGGSCAISISFTPTATGVRTATLTMTDNAAGSPQAVNLVGTGQTAVQVLSLSVVNSDFGVEPVGFTTGTGVYSATLNGEAPITFTSVAIAGGNAADFAISSNSCTASLAPGSNCNVNVTFTPSAAGVRTATLQYTDSATGSPQSIGLAGVGETVTQTLVPNPQSLLFPATNDPAVGGGSSLIFNLTNTGDAPVTSLSAAVSGAVSNDFSISGNTCASTLAAGRTCQITVLFNPPAASADTAYSASVQILSSASTISVPLYGVGLPTGPGPAITVSTGGALDTNFGTLALGSSAGPVNITIQNTTGNPVTLTNIALTGANSGDFTLGSSTCPGTLIANGSCTQAVSFTPSGLGQRTAAIQVTDSGSGSPHLGALAGFAVASPQTVSISTMGLDFGVETSGGTSTAQTVTLTNNGTAAVTISSTTFSGSNPGDFGFSNNQCAPPILTSLAVGASCNISMAFVPTASGVRTATLSIADSATGSPQSVMLSGDGQTSAEVLTVTTPTLAFGATNDGVASGVQNASVASTGTATVHISSYTFTGANAGDFLINTNQCTNSFSNQLTQNQSCFVQIFFKPTSTGVETATLNFNDDAPGSPHTVSLTGVGQSSSAAAENLVVNNPTLAFAATNDGVSSAGQNAFVTSTGTATVHISSYTFTGTNPGDFLINSNQCTSSWGNQLPENQQCFVQILFKPTSTGVETATLNFNDDAPGSPHTISLTGVGQSSSAAAENLVVNNPTLAFAATNDGVSSAGQNAFVTSTGTATVHISSYTFTGTNPGDFLINSNQCTSSRGNQLAENQQCFVQILFKPTSTGVETATLNFNDDAPGSPHTISLTGVGQSSSAAAENLVVNNPTLAFAATNDGVSSAGQNAFVTSTGTATVHISSYTFTGANPGDFLINSNQCTSSWGNQLAENQQCFVQISFKPTSTGVETATLNFNDDAPGSPHTVSLTGVGQSSSAAAENLVVDTPTLAFGTTNDGVASAVQNAFVTSTGTATVHISSYTFTGANAGDFLINNNVCTNSYGNQLAENQQCFVQISFKPTSTGVETATLNFNDDAPGSPHTVSVTGVGQSSAASAENLVVNTPTLAFGTTNDGVASAVQNAFVTSTGTATVHISSYTFTGANAGDFLINNNVCTNSYGNQLTENQQCFVQISFKPTSTGVETATLNFNDDAPGSPHTVLLTGFGQAPIASLTVTTPTLTYAAQAVGTRSQAQSAIVFNTGNVNLSVGGAGFTGSNPGDFSISFNDCAQIGTLSVTNDCYFNIWFTPSGTGTRTATFQIFSNAVGSPQTVTLTGTGQ